jgi:integrase
MKVTIENLEGRLRLRWTCPETGKRKNLALGLNDGISGRGEAARVKAWIETDAQHGYYDSTLTKYLPQKKRQQVTGITTVELFDRFTQYKQKYGGSRKALSKASLDTRYKYLKVMLEKHLDIPASSVDCTSIDAFTLVCQKLKPDTAKQRIWLLKAAWDWGKDKFQLPDPNPWDGIAKRFDSVPVQPVPAFSRDEVKKILDGFRNSPHYDNYLDYVRFRLSMATRPQEVRDLKWKHILADFSSVWLVSNKTKKGRTVTLDPSIASMLSARRDRLKPASDDELVFTSREGLPIDNRNFRRLWIIVLAKVGVPYRKPYTTRKTSVRHSLLNGGNYIEVAAAAGHDPHTMHKYYGDAIQQDSVLVPFE